MHNADVHPYQPYTGYPQDVPTHYGTPMLVVLDATADAAWLPLWGMTLLERNLRLVERLGAARVHVIVRPDDAARVRRRRFPASLEPVVETRTAMTVARELAATAAGPVLLLEAAALYDRRAVHVLWQSRAPALLVAGSSPTRAAALLLPPGAELPDDGNEGDWNALQQILFDAPETCRVPLETVEQRVSLLRKSVAPLVLRIHDQASLRQADAYLKELAGKGVNDLMAEFVHPPLEFMLTRLVARTRITPNQVSYFNLLLNVVALPLLAGGWLWTGLALNLLRGVTDGVDGKLARLTLRESKGGDRVDHVVDRLYLPAFFLALGWHLSGGNLTALPALSSYFLLVFYLANRLLATWFGYFVGASSGDYRPVDRAVRRFWPKRNICVLILLLSLSAGQPEAGLHAMTALTGLMVIYRIVRLHQEGHRIQRQRQERNEAGAIAASPASGAETEVPCRA